MEHILAMDDELFMIDVITGMLFKCGYLVIPAKDGLETLMFFLQAEESGKPFAASILDLTGDVRSRSPLFRVIETSWYH